MYSIEKFYDQGSGKLNQRVYYENRVQILPSLVAFLRLLISTKYEFDRKSKVQVLWLLKTEITFMDKMA